MEMFANIVAMIMLVVTVCSVIACVTPTPKRSGWMKKTSHVPPGAWTAQTMARYWCCDDAAHAPAALQHDRLRLLQRAISRGAMTSFGRLRTFNGNYEKANVKLFRNFQPAE